MRMRVDAAAEVVVEQEQVMAESLSVPVVDRGLVEQLVGSAREQGVAIDGDGGVLAQLTKLVVVKRLRFRAVLF